MDKKIRNLIVTGSAAAALAASVGVFSHIAAGMLMNLALDRPDSGKHSGGHRRASGNKTVSELKKLSLALGEELAGKELEEVEIESFDGTRLVGHWYPCENAEKVIVAMHGWRSSWYKDFGALSEYWHKRGCSVVFAEQRGQNKSGGEVMSFGILERRDCVEWAKWAQEKTEGKLPIYLMGVSMGAATVMMASCLELPENVKGIIADCGYTSPHDIWGSVTQNRFHIPYVLCRDRAERICLKRVKEGARAHTCPNALKNSKVPVMFVHGSDDKFVPIEMTYENYKACTADKRLLIVPGAEHGMSYMTDPEKYQEAMELFWKGCESV